MEIQAVLGLILAVLTAATALAVQLERLLRVTALYMRELRDQNVIANRQAQALVDATRSVPPTE